MASVSGGRRFGRFGFQDHYYERPFSATIGVSSGNVTSQVPKVRDPYETSSDLPAAPDGYSYVVDELHISTDVDLATFQIEDGSGRVVYGPHTIPQIFGVVVFGPPGVVVGDGQQLKVTANPSAGTWTGRIDIRGKIVPV